ncbi:MAG: hypothetical protein IJG38_12440 [Thermoguttaceae bacterium]|nr:hypothetical protein [Thermoguttaceae bacterium]MBQ6615126.1 hypothetical protein [Thermoguttaceae bacterium]
MNNVLHFLKVVSLLISQWYIIVIYLTINIILSFLIVNGFEITGPNSAEFWGCQLSGFHITGKGIVEGAFLEFCNHTWWITLFFIPLFFGNFRKTWDIRFENFLKFSIKSPLYMESARVLSVMITLSILILPFILDAVLGEIKIHLEWQSFYYVLFSNVSSIVFIVAVYYFVVSNRRLFSLHQWCIFSPILISVIVYYIKRQNHNLTEYLSVLPTIPYMVVKDSDFHNFLFSASVLLLVILFRMILVNRNNTIE